MSIQTTTTGNNQNNSLTQSNIGASNSITVGNIGGSTTQTSSPTSNGTLGLTIPALMLVNLQQQPVGPHVYLV